MSTQAINDSLRNVAKAQELIRYYIKQNIISDPVGDEGILLEIDYLLSQSVDILSSACSM